MFLEKNYNKLLNYLSVGAGVLEKLCVQSTGRAGGAGGSAEGGRGGGGEGIEEGEEGEEGDHNKESKGSCVIN